MTENKISNIHSLPTQSQESQFKKHLNDDFEKEFEGLLIQKDKQEKAGAGSEIEFSGHAAKRLSERNLKLDSNEFLKLKEAMTQLKNKGSKDSLIITEKAAYIVDVDNSKVVTAIDKNNIKENVFTKIDSTIILT